MLFNLDLYDSTDFDQINTYLINKKSDLTFIEIYVICEVPSYFLNILIKDRIIWLGTTMNLTSGHEFDLDLKA